MKPTIIITMAGEGSRFRLAGYDCPKYEIPVNGRTLFYWSLWSLKHFIDAACPVVFIARKQFQPEAFIQVECRKLGIRSGRVVLIDALTDGQATTVLSAKADIGDKSAPIIVYNIDTYVEPDYLRPERVKGDGWIPCFEGKGDAWSFALADENDRVSEVREKKRISPHATVGLYMFSSFNGYEAVYHQYYSDPAHLEAKERYIAPLYNQLIRDGRDVYIERIPVKAVHALGTPEEVELFRNGAVIEASA